MRNSVKVVIGAVLAGTVGLVIWWQTQSVPEPEPVAGTVAESPPEPAAEPSAEPATEVAVVEVPEAAPEPAPKPAPAAAPEFDVVRVSPDGQAVIAGRAAPDQTVEILLDGTVIGTVEADATGAFATVLEVAPSGEPRELTLRTALADALEDVVALAPTAEAAADKAAAEQAAEAAAGSVEPEVSRYALSAPVIILPQQGAAQAPILVKPEPEGVTLLQPAMTVPAAGIVLDRITYSEQGDLLAAGRGRPGAIVRIYANARFVEEIRCDEDGKWDVRIASEIAMRTRLLRFDEVDAEGTVLSRLETPFEYSALATTLELRERKIVVQKGDYLWKFAEQHYGEGIRYSVIFSANSALIRDPDLIYPGQVFTVPELVESQ